jgi:hypothetical protein
MSDRNRKATKPTAPSPNPRDEAVPGTPGTGENICPACKGGGRIGAVRCETCGGTGRVIEGIGGG